MTLEATALGIVHSIYGAAGDASLWPGVLQQITDAVGGTGGTLLLARHSESRPAIFTSTGIDPRALRDYDAHYVRTDLRLQKALRLPVGGVLSHDELQIHDAEFERSEFCAEFLRPLGLFYITGSTLLKDPDFVSVLGIHRPRAAGDYPGEALQLLALLLPHLQQALRLHARLSLAEIRCVADEQALDALGVAALLVDGRRSVLAMNAKARRLLAAADGLALERQRLVAARPALTRRLDALIADAVQWQGGAVAEAGGRMALPRPSLRRALAVWVSPVHVPARAAADRAEALLVVTDPDESATPSCESWAQLYGFTPAESRLASFLANGRSLAEACEQLHVTAATGRTHLKHLFQKTDTRRQAELAVLLLRTRVG